ncbi:NF-X1-type zinc finger protein NFXL2 [Triticum urartu]|uniref:NF-X1-type zinc finger protein NFXL2 n=1 Tax=Triticum urartu TaxID=4572 RepID=M7ZK64_TRIUA|nr:NF-X1-type zinc finger protein NFXL2 [Triticum urartu]
MSAAAASIQIPTPAASTPASCFATLGHVLHARLLFLTPGASAGRTVSPGAVHISAILVRVNAINALAVNSTVVRWIAMMGHAHRVLCGGITNRTCPCGKKDYPRLECDVEAATCGSTCEKVLGCGRHKCPERCHRGPCDVTCRLVIKKSCRCGVLKKEAYIGACSPCPLMKTISCFCGKTYFEVPCGTEKNQKPPKCSKRCNIDRLCRHKLDCRPHKCHYGACPPCKLICGEELSCGHKCKERCHGSIPPPNPEFTVKPMKKKMEKHIECTPGTPCPPCQEVVLVPCFGEHLGQERAIPCSKSRQFPCQNLCGNLLHCGNHYCTKDCHVLEIPSDQRKADTILSLSRNNTLAEPCERCNLRCQRCVYYNNLNAKQQLKARSCSGPCHRKLPNCPHLCSEICHPGQCPSVDQCMKKVNVRCACNTLKKEWVCQDVLKEYRRSGRDPKEVPKGQFGVGLLACGGDCVKKVNVSAAELHLRKVHETKSPAAEVANVPKRRKKRDRGAQEPVQVSMWQQIKWYLVVIIALAGLVVLGLVIWKGVYQISDWMNEMEEQKARERLLRAGRL